MADQCAVIEEQGFLTDTAVATFINVITETGKHAEVVSGFRSIVIFESLTYAESVAYVLSAVIAERGRLSGSFTQVGQPFYTISERGRSRDAIFPVRSVTIVETGTVADTPTPSRSFLIAEAGRLIDTLFPVRSPVVVIAEHGKSSDALSYVRAMVISETGILSDLTATQRSAILAEVGVLADAMSTGGLRTDVLMERGVLADLIVNVLHARMTIREEVFADADAILPGRGLGWTANSDTWGMSRYTEIDFNSIAVIDGVIHGAGDAGLYRLDANDDAGAPIDAGIDTGLDDMGSAQVKALGYAYAGLQSDGDMLMQVTSAEGANRLTYTYLFEDRLDGEGFAPTRAKLGKGIESRYWKFGLRNKAGSNFSLDDLIVLYDQKSRKV